MTKKQEVALRCAMADLIFSSVELCHESAGQTIIDLYDAFPDILKDYVRRMHFLK